MKIFKHIFILFSICSISLSVKTQEINSFETTATLFEIDNLGYYYFAEGSKLIQTDSEFNSLYEFSNKSYGDISIIDVSNPFQILVFYKDFNVLLFFDNKLSPLRDPIVLDDLGLYSIDAVCSTTTGSFRVYDNQTSTVITIGNDLSIVQKGTNLYSLAGDQKAIALKETANFVFLQTENSWIIRMDKFGNYIETIANDQGITFDCLNDDVYIITKTSVSGFDIKNERFFFYSFDPLPIKDFKIKDNKLFILSEKSLITFRIL
jgi:hypothetical protein